MKIPELRAGIYRHYKGPLYLVLGYAHDANADEFYSPDESDRFTGGLFPDGRTVVVYVGLELDGAHTGARLAVRTAADFFAYVCSVPTCEHYGDPFDPISPRCSYCGDRVGAPRFAYVGPTWEGKR